MFPVPRRFKRLKADRYGLDRRPILSVNNMMKPHHYEAFLSHPDFPKDEKGRPNGGRALWHCLDEKKTAWFNTKNVELALAELAADDQLSLSVNIEPMSIDTPQFAENLSALLRNDVTLATRLNIEITEHSAHSVDDRKLCAFGDKMHEEGATVLLDDVGTGRYDLFALNADVVAMCDGIKFPSKLISPQHGIVDPDYRAKKNAMLGLSERMMRQGKTVTLEGIGRLGALQNWHGRGMIFDYVQPCRHSRLQNDIKRVLGG